MSDAGSTPPEADLVGRVSHLARSQGLRVAVAESLTCGRVTSALGSGEAAAEWLCGGVVAYAEDVKFRVLGVTPGPVVTETCAREMAEGVRRLLHCDVAVAITGVGGPGPVEDCPPGTVHVAVAGAGAPRTRHARLSGEPADVVAGATSLALAELVEAMSSPPRV